MEPIYLMRTPLKAARKMIVKATHHFADSINQAITHEKGDRIYISYSSTPISTTFIRVCLTYWRLNLRKNRPNWRD